MRTLYIFVFLIFLSFLVGTQYQCKQHKEYEVADAKPSSCDSIYVIAGKEYAAGKTHEFIWGTQYRKEWITPVKVPCLDMKAVDGGLTPLQVGGGKQTTSLRLKSGSGYEYTLRSVNKDPEAVLPKVIRKTFLADWIQDMMSTANPYGALIVPLLAKAAGVYHTYPRIVYIPYTDDLGEFKDQFGGMLALLEIRPDEDLSEFKRFGFSENVVGTKRLYEQLAENNDNQLDEHSYVNARLFDMLINDWDRHEDQWRWAEYDKPAGGEFYRPVPRDRDQAFVKFEGALPFLMSRKFGIRNIRNFDDQIDDVRGINLNARIIDRTLINGLSREEWLAIANSMRTALTDRVIDNAVRALPPEIYAISGEETARKLKSRRDQLTKYAEEYYYILSEEVNVPGTDKNEKYIIETLPEGRVRITVIDTDPGDGDIFYQRTFSDKETEKVIIHPKGGTNEYEFRGNAPLTISIKILVENEEDIPQEINNKKNINFVQEKSGLYIDAVHSE